MEGVSHERPRLAIAVEPALFGDALASALEVIDVDEVIHLDPVLPPRAQEFDAVVASMDLPAGVRAPVVIRIPPDPSSQERAFVDVDGRHAEVEVGRLSGLLGVLDTYCPGSRQRLTIAE